MYSCSKDYLILSPLRLPQISCFTLSLKSFSSGSDNWSDMGIRPLLQFPHPLRAGPVLLTLLFFSLVPSSYRVVLGSVQSFPLVRYSCLFSAGVLMHFCVWSCTPDVSRKEMHSSSIYSSAILSPLLAASNSLSLVTDLFYLA